MSDKKDPKDYLKIRGARQHNLKNLNIDIPKNKLVVFTGVSGSGKSSLAFDTIYAEGQRRYVESLSTYARQFLGLMEKPDVDLIEGLSPAISIDQKTSSRNPRSTVGTVTEIYDYMRLLFARIGHPHCPICGKEISSQTIDQIADSIMELIKEKLKTKKIFKFFLLSPVVTDKKGEFANLFDNLKAKGFTSVRIDSTVKNLSEDFVLIKTNKHTIEVVIDKVAVGESDLKKKIFEKTFRGRLVDSIEQSLKLSDGLVVLAQIKDKSFEIPDKPKEFEDHLYSEKFACPKDNIQLPEVEPRTFSFNSPHGACDKCEGIGHVLKVDPKLIFTKEISITEGAILPFANIFEKDTWYARLILKVCETENINPKTAFKNLSDREIEIITHGTGDKEYKVEGTNRFGKMTYIYETFSGVINELEDKYTNTDSEWTRKEIEKYMREKICPQCNGSRLNPEALGVTIDSINISEATNLTIIECYKWIKGLSKGNTISPREEEIARLVINELCSRLSFLASVGLDYLTLSRSAATLSGGEAQRIRLASQIGSGLTGVLYILDEPTIGLHMKDNNKLIDTLKKLKNLGNSVLVVEHDAEMMSNADHIVDFGPGAGKMGGKLVVQGNIKNIIKDKKSLTGKYLSGKKKIKIYDDKLLSSEKKQTLKIKGASQYNLKKIDVEFPLGKFIVIAGVSGSGKSTLLVETLYPAIQSKKNPYYKDFVGKHKELVGSEFIDKVILIDQSPIGRTPRSNPATYTKLFDLIRDVFASTKEAKANGYKKGRFSFNVKGGRCESCEGQGKNKIEMQFMSDLWITCEVCRGKRYNNQTLEIEYKGKNISEVLDMTVEEALEFFHNHPRLVKKLETLKSVGLTYMELGQPATTLSGGEAQRVKLATELSKKSTGDTLYILDEPTTGLHFYDVENLLKVLRTLVSRGNTVVVIEHNPDVIKNADWVIDLGPGGGEKGGEVIAVGTVNQIKKINNSVTGRYL